VRRAGLLRCVLARKRSLPHGEIRGLLSIGFITVWYKLGNGQNFGSKKISSKKISIKNR
jgi:hypothetical protein